VNTQFGDDMERGVYGFRGFKFRTLFYRHGYTVHYAEHVVDPRDGREKLVMADPHNRFSVVIYDVGKGVIEEELVVPGKSIPNPHVAHILLEDVSVIGGKAGDIVCADREGRWVLIDRDEKRVKWSLSLEDTAWPHDIVPIEEGFIVTDYGSGGEGGFVRKVDFNGVTKWSLPMSGAAKVSRIFGSTASGIHSNSFGGDYIVAQNSDVGGVYELDDEGRVVWKCPKSYGEVNSIWLFKPHSAFRLGLAEASGNLTIVGLEAGGGIVAIDYYCRPRWGVTSTYSHIPVLHYRPSTYGLLETTHVFPTLWGTVGAIDWRGYAGSAVIEIVEVPRTPLTWVLALGIDPGDGVWLDPPLEVLDREFVAMDLVNSGEAKVRWSLHVTRQPALIESKHSVKWQLYSSGIVEPGSVQSIELDNRRNMFTFARVYVEKVSGGRAALSIFVVWL
jgi:hypothetical protein